MAKCSGLPKGHGPGRPVKGLPYAVQNISVQLSVAVENVIAYLQASIWTLLVPALIVLVMITMIMTVVWRIQKIMCPPTAAELHRQALLLLMKQEQQTQQQSDSSKREPYQQVLQLLTKALQQDPTYLPARLSLIALHVYRLFDGHAAVRELQKLLDEQHGTMDIATTAQTQGLLLDAQAMISGQGHMVQVALQEDRYLRTIPPLIKSNRYTSSPRTYKANDDDRLRTKRKTQ
jgi:hypothetical protein